MKKHLPYALCIITLVIGFYGGTKYQSGRGPAGRAGFGQNLSAEQRQQFRNTGGGARGGQGGGLVGGEVLSKDDKSVTVKMRDGSSKIIFISPSTVVSKSVTGAATDLQIGQQVTVTGAAQADGSVAAESVQIRPMSAPDSPVK